MKNKFDIGGELGDAIESQSDKKIYEKIANQAKNETLWQTWHQSYWPAWDQTSLQITSYIKGAVNEK